MWNPQKLLNNYCTRNLVMKIVSLYRDLKPVQKVPNPKQVLYDVHYIMDEMENDTFAPRVHVVYLMCLST